MVYTKQFSVKAGTLIYDPNDPSRILMVTKVSGKTIQARPYLQYIQDNNVLEFDAKTDIKSFSNENEAKAIVN